MLYSIFTFQSVYHFFLSPTFHTRTSYWHVAMSTDHTLNLTTCMQLIYSNHETGYIIQTFPCIEMYPQWVQKDYWMHSTYTALQCVHQHVWSLCLILLHAVFCNNSYLETRWQLLILRYRIRCYVFVALLPDLLQQDAIKTICPTCNFDQLQGTSTKSNWNIYRYLPIYW